MHSIEVERITRVGAPSADGFVVGKVLSVEQHPDADRLSVCEVDAGEGGRTIVCGAPNVAAGQTVPVALPGAVMPDGTKLGKAKLRGVESDGMILSEAELEIGDDADGIAVLDETASRPGTPLGRGDPGLGAGDRAGADLEPGRLLRRLRRGARGARDHRRRAGAARPGTRTPRRRARARSPTTPRSRSRCRSSARASPPGSSPTSRSGRRRSGSRRA